MITLKKKKKFLPRSLYFRPHCYLASFPFTEVRSFSALLTFVVSFTYINDGIDLGELKDILRSPSMLIILDFLYHW